VWSPLPSIVYGSLSLISGFSYLYLPETLGRHLPDTIAEAENFRKTRKGNDSQLRDVFIELDSTYNKLRQLLPFINAIFFYTEPLNYGVSRLQPFRNEPLFNCNSEVLNSDDLLRGSALQSVKDGTASLRRHGIFNVTQHYYR